MEYIDCATKSITNYNPEKKRDKSRTPHCSCCSRQMMLSNDNPSILPTIPQQPTQQPSSSAA